jgi:hypothetical protein
MECQNFDYLSYQPLAASHLCESMSFIAAKLMIPFSHCNNLEASSIYLLDDSWADWIHHLINVGFRLHYLEILDQFCYIADLYYLCDWHVAIPKCKAPSAHLNEDSQILVGVNYGTDRITTVVPGLWNVIETIINIRPREETRLPPS